MGLAGTMVSATPGKETVVVTPPHGGAGGGRVGRWRWRCLWVCASPGLESKNNVKLSGAKEKAYSMGEVYVHPVWLQNCT